MSRFDSTAWAPRAGIVPARRIWQVPLMAAIMAMTAAAVAFGPAALASDSILSLPGDAEITVHAGQSFKVALAGPEGATFWVEGMPDGLAFDGAAGTISGAIANPGEYTILVGASSPEGVAQGMVAVTVISSQARPSPIAAMAMASSSAPSLPRASTTNFFGDKNSAILLRNADNHHLNIWRMDGNILTQAIAGLPLSAAEWEVAGVGDFNGDGHADILWRNIENGWTAIWFMNNGKCVRSAYTNNQSGLMWQVVGVGDFVGLTPSRSQVLWRHRETHELAVWQMNDVFVEAVWSPSVRSSPEYEVVGVGDFNGDGRADILWRHTQNHSLAAWFMNGRSVIWANALSTQNTDAAWEVEGVYDFSGRGQADILWRHRGDHSLYIWRMQNAACHAVLPLNNQINTRMWEVQERRVR